MIKIIVVIGTNFFFAEKKNQVDLKKNSIINSEMFREVCPQDVTDLYEKW